jgi:signal transduction histidine kinase/PAS domain-containing protein
VGLDELIATQDPRQVAHLVQGQVRLLELIDRPRPPMSVLHELAHVLESQIADTVCEVMQVSDDGQHLSVGAAPNLPEELKRAVDGVAVGPTGGWCALAAFSRRPVIVEDIRREARWLDVRKSALAVGLQACWSMPILAGSGDALGTLSMYHRRPTAPSSIHLGLLTFATMLARVAIERDRSDREHERLGDAERLSERYRMVLRATREAVWDWDLTTNVIVWNDGLQALGHDDPGVGAGPEWWLERIHPGDVGRIRQSLEAALADPERTSWEDEYAFRRGDGDFAEIDDRAIIARDRAGVALRMVGAMKDITRHKRQSLEILHLAERLRSATAAASVGTWQLEPRTNQFRADASLNRLLGREVRDTTEPLEDVLRLVHPDDRREILRARNETLDALKPFAVEHRVVLEDCAIRWLRSRGHALLDERGQVQNIIGAVADITDLKQIEQSMALLADATRLLGQSLDTDRVIAAIAQMAVPGFADGAIVYLRNTETGALDLAAAHAASPQLDASLKDIVRSRDFHVGVPAHRVLRSGQSERHATLTPEWLSAEDTDLRIIPLVHRFHVSSLIFAPLVLDGAPAGVVGFFGTKPRRFSAADLSFAEELARRASQAMNNARVMLIAKRERARAEEAQSLRERLLDIMGHDLRNPLSAITGAVGLLERRELGARELAVVKRIGTSAMRMSRLIGQVLDFARIKQGKSLPMSLRPANLHEICVGVIEELRLGNPTREITVALRGHGEATCDPDRIAEALSNLVGNAVQHGAEGAVDVCIDDAAPDGVAIAIHNTGAIPADAQVSIFEPYQRRPSSDDYRSRSVGLGLFIAKEIVKAHKGSISLCSTPERGTTFTVVLARDAQPRAGEAR